MKSLNLSRMIKLQSQIDEWSSQFYNVGCSDYDSELASLASCISASIEQFWEVYLSDESSSDMALKYIK